MPYREALGLIFYIISVVVGGDIPRQPIDWIPCKENTSFPLICGSLMVPLDYENASSNTSMRLEMVKISAGKQPKQGTILINPGGPGLSGREFLAGASGPALQVATGGVYDLIGFDPRGTSNTIPFSCFTDAASRANFNLKTPVFLNSSDTAIGQIRAASVTFAESCRENAEDIGDLIGTGYVARDMMQIVDALNEDGLLHYWGFSYGTALGSTVAALFPGRMGRVVLDGVLNPHDYFTGRDVSQVTASDRSFEGFCSGCVANPSACRLAEVASNNADGLCNTVYELLYKLKYDPFVTGSSISDIIDYTVLKGAIQTALLNPLTWPGLALGLYGLLTENVTEARTLFSLTVSDPTVFPDIGQEAGYGIRLSDVVPETRNATSLQAVLDEFYATSRLLGDSYARPALTYGSWPFKGKGRYRGDFNHIKTETPILFVGSDLDPVTPLANAQNASAGFEGSVVLQHEGYGHTSPAQPSLCTARAIRSYFVNGTLPAPGTKCPPVFDLFSNHTVDEALALLGKRTLEDDGEMGLMSAVMQLNTMMPRMGVK